MEKDLWEDKKNSKGAAGIRESVWLIKRGDLTRVTKVFAGFYSWEQTELEVSLQEH